jgi:hypothetical protein
VGSGLAGGVDVGDLVSDHGEGGWFGLAGGDDGVYTGGGSAVGTAATSRSVMAASTSAARPGLMLAA